jgi:hypothetical protein
MKLKARTTPMPARPAPPAAAVKKPTAAPVAAAKKSNPFGAASAVDTASKLAEMDLKKKDQPAEKIDMWKKEPQIAPKKEEPVEKMEVQKKPVEPEAKVVAKDSPKEEGFTTVVAPSSKEEAPAAKEQPEADSKKAEEKEKEKKRREPEKVNSRAAAFETAPVRILGVTERSMFLLWFTSHSSMYSFFLHQRRAAIPATEENQENIRILGINRDLLL